MPILSFKNRTFFSISPTAKFKAHPKQCLKNAFGFSDKLLLETPFLIPPRSLVSIHKEKTDEINLKNVANVFCEVNEERRRTFCIFRDTSFLQLSA